MRWNFLPAAARLAIGLTLIGSGALAVTAMTGDVTLDPVVPNDNRVSAGRIADGVLMLDLEARAAAWRPDPAVDSAVTVQVFSERGGAPRIPGPLLRTTEGTEVRVAVRNSLDAPLIVHGLRAGTVADDTLHVAVGETREVRYRPDRPGTYLYWGSSTGEPIQNRSRRDSQLTGAIVVDPAGARPDSAERIFVMTVIDIFPDSVLNPAGEDVWELAINGRAWPDTERLEYPVGETVRWRWLNGSYLPHPMHLHGFHFTVVAKGDGATDTIYAPHTVRSAVTEFMMPGSTFAMEWVPTRAGTWLMHCHMIPHITPYPARADSTRGHDLHDVARHPLDAMAGLVLGITTVDAPGVSAPQFTPTRRLRLLVQQAAGDADRPTPRGYVLQRATEPHADSVEVPGTPLVLTRGETTAITVVNRMREETTVHWHGMELESVYDGVSGWSRTGSNLAPLLAPGDSFTVAFTPPRAGTFIYHTHMDEGEQLRTGLYGPLLVLEPGERYELATDLTFLIGDAVERDTIRTTLNGRLSPAPLTLVPGRAYRLRFINIHPAAPAEVELSVGGEPVSWRPIAKDGAELPVALRNERPATLRRFGVGETFDVEWTPTQPVDAVLLVRNGQGAVLRQELRVRR